LLPLADSTGCHLRKVWATSGHTLTSGQAAVSPLGAKLPTCKKKLANVAQQQPPTTAENLEPGIRENPHRKNSNHNFFLKKMRVRFRPRAL
jgi:hypothetical protein